MRSKYAARVCGANIEHIINEGCRQFVLPKTNTAFWQAKIDRNRERDRQNYQLLFDAGWQVIVIWTCNLTKGKTELTMQQVSILLSRNLLAIYKKGNEPQDKALENSYRPVNNELIW